MHGSCQILPLFMHGDARGAWARHGAAGLNNMEEGLHAYAQRSWDMGAGTAAALLPRPSQSQAKSVPFPWCGGAVV